MSQVLGSQSYLSTPDVNGALVLTTTTGVNSVLGTTNQIAVSGSVPTFTVGIDNNPIFPGTGSMTMPVGTTAERPVSPAAGMIRFNTTLGASETYNGTAWVTGHLILQVVTGLIATSSGSTTVPYDNTTPTITEGWQIWTESFTPVSATSRLIIQYTITTANSANNVTNILSTFAGNTNIGSVSARVPATGGTTIPLTVSIVYSPGSTAAITFTARLGGSAAGTSYCNRGSTATLGGAYVTEYSIIEVR